jgi:hypothetical protein
MTRENRIISIFEGAWLKAKHKAQMDDRLKKNYDSEASDNAWDVILKDLRVNAKYWTKKD